MTKGAKREEAVRVRKPAARKAKAASSGLSPLDYMLGVMRDEAQTPAARMAAAKSAAPYLHARVASVEEREEKLERASEKLLSLIERAHESGHGIAGLIRS